MFITQNNYHAQKSSLIIDRKLVIIKITPDYNNHSPNKYLLLNL